MFNHILSTIMVMLFVAMVTTTIQNYFHNDDLPQTKPQVILNTISMIGFIFAYGYATIIVIEQVIQWLQNSHIYNLYLQIIVSILTLWFVVATFLSTLTIHTKKFKFDFKTNPIIKYSALIGVCLLLITLKNVIWPVIQNSH